MGNHDIDHNDSIRIVNHYLKGKKESAAAEISSALWLKYGKSVDVDFVASLRLHHEGYDSNKSGKLQVDTSILGIAPSCKYKYAVDRRCTSFVPIIHRPRG